MLTETLSGKCPVCSYDKLLQRYGSMGYHQMDGCPSCGFGYASNGQDPNDAPIGFDQWKDYAAHILSCADTTVDETITDDSQVVRTPGEESGWMSITYNGGKTKEDKAYEIKLSKRNTLPDMELRQQIFDWAEKQDRSDDVETTVWVYTPEDIEKFKATNPVIFK